MQYIDIAQFEKDIFKKYIKKCISIAGINLDK